MEILKGKKILLGITGGIAAYKCCELVRLWQKAGAEVMTVMTPAATNFITPLTMASLTAREVLTDTFSSSNVSIDHIRAARWADLVVIAPATANTIAKISKGIADNLLTCTVLASSAPVVVAPAMNCVMYENPATQENISILKSRGITLIGPDAGYQACGDTGRGRMSEPSEIFRRTASMLIAAGQTRRMVITAGPTEEPIDPVRCLTNRSSGKMGYALAQAAAAGGWKVKLISGPVSIDEPVGVETVRVRTAGEMLECAWREAKEARCFIGCAAVADFKPLSVSENKIKKTANDGFKLSLTQNPDIIKTVAALDGLFTVGFAAETNDLLVYARHKLETKKLDMIVANDVSSAQTGFNSDDNEATIIYRDGRETAFPKMSKEDLALRIIEAINDELAGDCENKDCAG
jgi:phosphopantothenoylcysteine decarboxylase/phosphopantothenate--cysteine ligase